MELGINRSCSLGIKEQIKRQIKHLVDFGHFKEGQELPSAKQMAQVLSVNRNTVASAYKELVGEGVLESRVGLGTFVGKSSRRGNAMRLQDIITDTFHKAAEAGFTAHQVEDYLLSYMTQANLALKNKTALVLECNQEALDDISSTLRKTLGVKTLSVLMSSFETSSDEAYSLCSQVDIVVCGFNHVHEFYAVVPQSPCDVVGVLLKPNIVILNELTRLASGTRVGFICATNRSTRTFYKDYLADGGDPRLRVAWIGMDSDDEIAPLIRSCDVVFATNYVFERVSTLARQDTRVVKVDLSVDQSNIEVVKERLLFSELIKRDRQGVPYEHQD